MLRLSRKCRSCSCSCRESEFNLRPVLLLFYCDKWQINEEGRDGWCWYKMSLDDKRTQSEWWNAMRRNGYYIVGDKKRPKLNAEMGLPHWAVEGTQRETARWGGGLREGGWYISDVGCKCYSMLLCRYIYIYIYKYTWTIILPVFLYGCETWSLTLREERRLRVCENRVLRRVFGPKRDEVTGEWRKLHN